VDVGIFAGSFGLFFTLFLLFIRFLPIIAMSEVKGILPQAQAGADSIPHQNHSGRS